MEVRALTLDDAAAIAGWRYPGRLSTYDVRDRSVLAHDAWAVTDDGELFGYCCFGALARVAGGAEQAGVVDVGYGMEPGRMGRGNGHRFVGAILEFAVERFRPERLRLYVLDWNERSRHAAERHGFTARAEVMNQQGRFIVLERPAEGPVGRQVPFG